MATSSTTAQIGRQLWSSAMRSPSEILTFGFSVPLRLRSLNRVGLGQSFSRHLLPRSFQSSRPFSKSSKFSTHNVRRSCTSGGLLLLGFSSPSSSTQSVVAGCTAAADSNLLGNAAQTGNILRLARQAWQKNIHTSSRGRGRGRVADRRRKSTKSDSSGVRSTTTPQPPRPDTQKPASQPKIDPPPPEHHESLTDSMSKYLHLPNLPHLPKMPHRPTKEELLAAANGFFERLKVRFKWFSIRSMRPWNADEWGAFVSWIVLGHFVWILVGTTTFFSLLILMVNTVFAQETLAKWIGDYLTQAAGVTVVFESAIVPKWKDGVITFRNVFVSRRPGQLKSSVKKGSPSDAAAAAAARHAGHEALEQVEDDGNYTQFDLTINAVDVTLSFVKWWNGKGLLKDVEVKGVRGVVDRTSVVWSSEGIDPLSYRHKHQPGDFEIEHFKLEDLLVTVHQPGGFRPFSVSIFSCELPQLRKQWLFYDFLSASHMSGSFDGSLFTIHPRQIHGVPAGDEHHVAQNFGEPSAWKKFSRLRIDGLRIDHLNRGVEGPFGWIYEGNVDIVADVMFPADPDDSIGKVMSDFYDKMEEAVTSNRYLRILDSNSTNERDRTRDFPTEQRGHLALDHESGSSISPATHVDEIQTGSSAADPAPEEPPQYLVMDLRLHLNDVRAAVPMFHTTPDMSYINQTLIRPIVAYINTRHTYIPITCRIVKRYSDFDGSWTVFDCGLMDDLSAEVYSAFAHDVEDQQSRVRRLKKVGFWAVSVAVQALLVGVAGDLIT